MLHANNTVHSNDCPLPRFLHGCRCANSNLTSANAPGSKSSEPRNKCRYWTTQVSKYIRPRFELSNSNFLQDTIIGLDQFLSNCKLDLRWLVAHSNEYYKTNKRQDSKVTFKYK